MDLDLAVVVDVPLFAKFVHEKTYPGTRGADHFRQRFLAEGDRERLFAVLLAEIRQQQKQAREASFAGIEELVDQVVFDPVISSQQVGHEKCGKLRLRSKHRKHCGFSDRCDQALFHRCAGRAAQLRSHQTAFAEELPLPENPDHSFLAVLGQDRNLDLAFPDEVDAVGDVSLAEYLLVLPVALDGFSRVDTAQKNLGVKRVLFPNGRRIRHGVVP